MEENTVGFIYCLYAALGVMVFLFILDRYVSSRAAQERDKQDAAHGILKGKEAGRFVALAEKAVRDAKVREEIWRNLPYMLDKEPEELTPYQAGRAAYCLGKQAEDNPFRDARNR